MSSEVSPPTSTTPEEQRSSPPPFPSPLLASRSSSPSLPHPYTLPLPIPPPSSPQNPANMAPKQSPSLMMTALEILAVTALTFIQTPSTPPVSSQHPPLLYPFEEHSCQFDQTHPTSEDVMILGPNFHFLAHLFHSPDILCHLPLIKSPDPSPDTRSRYPKEYHVSSWIVTSPSSPLATSPPYCSTSPIPFKKP